MYIFLSRMMISLNIPRIISLKKSRKIKKFMLLRHYKCGYAQEYQLSPSNSPFLRYNCRKPINKRRYKDLYSSLFIGKCLGMNEAEKEYRSFPLVSKVLPAIEDTIAKDLFETIRVKWGR